MRLVRGRRVRWGALAVLVASVSVLASVGLGVSLAKDGGGIGRDYPPSYDVRWGELPFEHEQSWRELREERSRSAAAEEAQVERLGSPEATAERESSRSAYSGASAVEVQGLLAHFFAGTLSGLDYDPAALLGGEPTRFVGDSAAKVVRDGERLLVDSSIPLRAGGELVDLDLAADGSGWSPVNPLVPARLPKSLSDGISVGDFEVSLAGAADSAGVRVGDRRVLYHEVARDTDLVAFPVAQGVEVAPLLRSAEAPGSQTLRVAVPGGAALRATRSGGAAIVSDGRAVGSVLPPVAVDAQGQDVPVSMAVAGDDELRVSIADADRERAAYPILVDPVVDASGDWFDGNTAGMGNWFSQTNTTLGKYNFRDSCYAPVSCYGSGRGLHVYIEHSDPIAGGTFGDWNYIVPGSTTYITDMVWRHVYLRRRSSSVDPWFWLGISARGGGWVALSSIPTIDVSDLTVVQSGGGRTDAGGAHFGFTASGNVTLPAWRDGYVGGVSVTMSDPENPSVSVAHSNPAMASGWVNSGSDTATVDGSDPGLGIDKITFSGTGSGDVRDNPCSGTRSNPCPSSWSQQRTYNTSGLPEGTTQVSATVADAGGRQTVATWQYKIDRTDPNATIAGDGWPATGVVLPGERSVTVSATDAPSGVKSIEIQVDGQREFYDEQSSGNSMTRTWTYDTADYEPGQHTLKVIVTDQAGNTTTKEKDVVFGEAVLPDPPFGCDQLTAVTIASGHYGGPGNYLGLKADEPESNVTRVCWHVASGPLVNSSGAIQFTGASFDPGGSGVDPGEGDECLAQGGELLAQNTNALGTVRLSYYTAPDEAWVCVEAPGGVSYRLRLVVPSATEPDAQVGAHTPPLAPPAPEPWPVKASNRCETLSGGTFLVKQELMGRKLFLATRSAGTTADVCARHQDGSGSGSGGVVTVDPTSLPGEIGTSADLTPCTQIINHFDGPAGTKLYLDMSPGSDPQSVCVDAGVLRQRFFVGTSGGGNPVTFTPDA